MHIYAFTEVELYNRRECFLNVNSLKVVYIYIADLALMLGQL
jgi:hypothetical protein